MITLCDRVREVCPEFPGHPAPRTGASPIRPADPDGRPAFDRVAAELDERIEFLLHVLATEPAAEAS